MFDIRSRRESACDTRAAHLPAALPLALAVVWAVGAVGAPPAAAQELPLDAEVPLPGVTGYAADVPTPEEVIGHRIGTRHTEPHQVVRYFEAVAEVSDRVALEEHGRTYENRPLIHAVVASPGNHGRLEEIRRSNLRLSEAPGTVTDAELGEMPAVVYMGYSIHGDEASGTEAAVLLLYHLAAGQGPAVEAALDDLVVLVDPMFNPDGRHRFTTWVNQNRGTTHTTDPQDREHDQPWPGGRTNHYWFDLNRDWLPAAHPETRGRLEVFHRWRPQVLTDFHEMGSDATFFFQPGVPERTNLHTPPTNQELTAELAEYHARALDRVDQLYYTEEGFDDYYLGKGSTYPDVQGTVGILFEQASSRSLETETDHGPLHYATTVRNQFITSLSSLEGSVDLREELLRYQRDFYAGELDSPRELRGTAHLVGLDRGRTRAQALAATLARHRVEIHELAQDVEVEGQQFRAGEAYVIPLDQPQRRLVQAFMEGLDTFRDDIFYDVSTWTLPLAFDVDHALLERDPGPLMGAEVEEPGVDGGELTGEGAGYGYLLEWDRYFAPRALYRLMEEGAVTRLMQEPFTAAVEGGTRQFERGTVVIPLDQPRMTEERVHALVRRAVEEDHVKMHGVDTGLTPEGPDLGSSGSDVLEKPRVAVVTGGGTSAYDAGESWHLLSHRFGMPVSLVDLEDLDDEDLSRYSVIVMGSLWGGSSAAEAVESWVRDGGTLVATSGGAARVAGQGLVELERREFPMDSLLEGVPYGDLSEAAGAQNVGGSIFDVRLDTTHPVAYGLPETLPTFRPSGTFFDPSGEPGVDVGVYADDPVLSGYLSDARREQAGGAAAVVADRMGSGRAVLIMDNPNFRAHWYGSNRLFLNAVFFGQAF